MLARAYRAVRGQLGRMRRRTRHLPDRLRHPDRHRRLLDRLASGPRPREVLVVCYGNVCRSPYLEAALRRALPEDVRVRSAGFVGPDRPVPDVSAEVAMRRGLDLSPHRSQLLTPDLVRGADLVLVMDAQQADAVQLQFGARDESVVIVGDLDPEPAETRGIRDPWGREVEVFESSYTRLDRAASVLARLLTAQHPRVG
ncbi:MAG TPA: hypothetical protein VEA99_09165 [Gemmatimonadaceae bacterium]|nr:hypothetical protein [Gemmatimonadaceae bacterium]